MDKGTAIRWVVALEPESIAIRKKYQMTRVAHSGPYPVFTDATDCHWLTISGVGRVHAAAATMYLHQVSNAPPWAGWVNVGIAGHAAGTYGTLYLVDKIIDKSTGRSGYPGPVISSTLARGSLMTVDKPETNYGNDLLFDMEGSAIFEIACRLSCQQLVLVLKIVSDGPNIDIAELTSKMISDLVSDSISEIFKIVGKMEILTKKEHDRLELPVAYYAIKKKWHFSQSQEYRLMHLVKRWQATAQNKKLIPYVGECKDAKSVIRKLSIKLDNHEVDWGKG